MKRTLRSSRRVRRGERCSFPMVLSLLCTLFSVLPLTADDYVECTNPFPDELLDIFGLMERPVNRIPIPHVSSESIPRLNHPNPSNFLKVNVTIPSNILPPTVIRIESSPESPKSGFLRQTTIMGAVATDRLF